MANNAMDCDGGGIAHHFALRHSSCVMVEVSLNIPVIERWENILIAIVRPAV